MRGCSPSPLRAGPVALDDARSSPPLPSLATGDTRRRDPPPTNIRGFATYSVFHGMFSHHEQKATLIYDQASKTRRSDLSGVLVSEPSGDREDRPAARAQD